MSYVGNQSDMKDIWDWVSYPYSEEDQVVPCMPKNEIDYDLMMSLLPTPTWADEEPFEEEEEPSEEEHPGDDIGGVLADNSPYPKSSSY